MIGQQQMGAAHIYTRDEINKIGNTIIYFADRLKPLSKTKLLKLLYLSEEESIRKHAIPFLNLDFEVWQYGPVAKDIYVDVSSTEQYLLRDFIHTRVGEENRTFIHASAEFDDGEFSDAELALLEQVLAKYGHFNAEQLVELTHRPHSPWTLTAKHYGVMEDFINKRVFTTDYKIDFNSLLDESGQQRYADQLEYLEMSKSLK